MAKAQSATALDTRFQGASTPIRRGAAPLPPSVARYLPEAVRDAIAPPMPQAPSARFLAKLRTLIQSAWQWLAHSLRVALATTTGTRQVLHRQPAALRALIRNSRVALVTTRDINGMLHTEPMTAADREFDGQIWFTAPDSAPIVHDISARPAVQVTYVETTSNRCLVLDGIARTCRGTDLTRTVIRVDVISADVWE